MALIVEDGTVVAGAESYITVANATTYFSNRGIATWAALASDTVREQALRKATDYMVQAFKGRWKGLIVEEAQALDWPRTGVFVDGYELDSDSVPEQVQRACAELALKASAADLLADQEQLIVREKIGPIETEYDKYSPQAKRYPVIDKMLGPYLSGMSGANVRLERA